MTDARFAPECSVVVAKHLLTAAWQVCEAAHVTPDWPQLENLVSCCSISIECLMEHHLAAIGLLQVNKFLKKNGGRASKENTYVFEFGVNDYLNLVLGAEQVSVAQVINTINHLIETLYKAGARK